MLVLSRHVDEAVIVGDDIKVVVVDIRAEKVRLGFSAPAEVSVHRQEVYEAIQRERRAGSLAGPRPAPSLLAACEEAVTVERTRLGVLAGNRLYNAHLRYLEAAIGRAKAHAAGGPVP